MILVLGTSNLATIRESPLPNIQIESYPGPRVIFFGQARKKQKKTVKHGIISVEMNYKHSKPHSTTIPNLGKLLAKAKLVFPNSKIYMSQITYWDRLHPLECSNLQTINRFLHRFRNRLLLLQNCQVEWDLNL